MDLKSSICEVGKKVTQIIHGIHGEKRTFNGILTKTIKQGQFTKMTCEDGKVILINDNNILCIEVFNEDSNTR